jgi:AsmA protein
MKNPAKIIGIIVFALIALAIVLPFVVDVNAFRPKIESELSVALGRQVAVGNLHLSIFSGSVSADDLAIADDPAFGTAPFIRAKSLKVGVEMVPLIFSKALHVTHLTLENPEVSLVRSASGKWNLSSLGTKDAKEKDAKEKEKVSTPSTPTSNPDLSVGTLSIANGRISISEPPSQPHVYDKVNIKVAGFSFNSAFPFDLSADLPGGGSVTLEGKAGPVDQTDAASTPFDASIKVKQLDLAASGFVEASTGIAGLADFEGKVNSNGKQLHSEGTANTSKLKLSPKGSPAATDVQVKYAIEHNLEKQGGTLTQGDVRIGKALAQVTGTYQMQGESTSVVSRLSAQGMPVDDLVAMLPALGVVLPSGSSLKGGTLSTTLAISGPTDKLVITGPIKLSDTKLAGFNLASKMSAISALTGTKSDPDTSIQNLSTDARVAPEGIRTSNLNLTVPALGMITGEGTVSPAGVLNYKMNANLTGGLAGGLTQLSGMGSKTGVPFMIQGTTADPKFVPDVKGMLGGQLKSAAPGGAAGDAVKGISGLFGKKKTK